MSKIIVFHLYFFWHKLGGVCVCAIHLYSLWMHLACQAQQLITQLSALARLE